MTAAPDEDVNTERLNYSIAAHGARYPITQRGYEHTAELETYIVALSPGMRKQLEKNIFDLPHGIHAVPWVSYTQVISVR